MKFYLPYILLIFLIVVVAAFGAAMLFFKIDEDGNE